MVVWSLQLSVVMCGRGVALYIEESPDSTMGEPGLGPGSIPAKLCSSQVVFRGHKTDQLTPNKRAAVFGLFIHLVPRVRLSMIDPAVSGRRISPRGCYGASKALQLFHTEPAQWW